MLHVKLNRSWNPNNLIIICRLIVHICQINPIENSHAQIDQNSKQWEKTISWGGYKKAFSNAGYQLSIDSD